MKKSEQHNQKQILNRITIEMKKFNDNEKQYIDNEKQ